MCSGFEEGHSAENVEKAMISIEKHELEARGAAPAMLQACNLHYRLNLATPMKSGI